VRANPGSARKRYPCKWKSNKNNTPNEVEGRNEHLVQQDVPRSEEEKEEKKSKG
jgi:hypothetical protein